VFVGYEECKKKHNQEFVIKEEETILSHEGGQNQDHF
jgi:hypothetical protein